MIIEPDIDPATEHAARAFIAKVAARFDLVSAIPVGDGGGDAP